MAMDRLLFLKTLLGSTAALAFTPHELLLDPDKALWHPGATTIFLPAEKQIVAPPTPEIFDECIDLDRALRDSVYFESQVIGKDVAMGGQFISHARYVQKYRPQNHWVEGYVR